jgi:2-C-methyl-D-erythritol 4-phosphate cytidylyltransferase
LDELQGSRVAGEPQDQLDALPRDGSELGVDGRRQAWSSGRVVGRTDDTDCGGPGDPADLDPVTAPGAGSPAPHLEGWMRTGMIVLAGGIGRRIGRPVPKQFLLLGGKPLLIHVLEKARSIAEIEHVVITCPADHLDATRELVANHRMGAKFECVVGGASRQESALKGLQALGEVDSVIIHEAVRPLVSVADFRRLMDAEDENAMFGLAIPFTVLKGHDYIEGLLERDELVNVQLPQKFNREKLLAAHEAAAADGREFTEDASLFYEYAKEPVRILPGIEHNIKITVPTDTVTAEAVYHDLMGRRS